MAIMLPNHRIFEVKDPFERKVTVRFLWHQVGIAIRHADTIDCKYVLQIHEEEDEVEEQDKIIAAEHVDLLKLSDEEDRELSDPWVIKLAGEHLAAMIETGEDMEKTLVTMSLEDLRRANQALKQNA
jgi:hypothetical protein